MALFKVYRGNETNLPAEMTDGWAYFCTDSGNFYIDWSDGENLHRTQVNADYANNLKYLDGEEYAEISAAELMRRLITLEEDAKNHALKTDIVQSDFYENDSSASSYVKNRTHWRETVQVPLNIEWDGSLEGRASVTAQGFTFIKVSDIVLSDEELKKCVIHYNNGSSFNIGDGGRFETYGQSTAHSMGVAIARSVEDNFAVDGTTVCAQETGIYFCYFSGDGGYVTGLTSDTVTMDSYVYRKIPSEYLPEHVAPDLSQNDPTALNYVEGRTHWTDEEIEVLLPEVAATGDYEHNKLIGLVAGETYTVIFNGDKYECVAEKVILPAGDYTYYGVGMGNIGLLNGAGSTGEPFIIGDCYHYEANNKLKTVNVALVKLVSADVTEYTLSVEHKKSVVHELPTEYLQDWLPYTEEIRVPLDLSIDGDPKLSANAQYESGRGFIKVSGEVISQEELMKCTATVVKDGVSADVNLAEIDEISINKYEGQIQCMFDAIGSACFIDIVFDAEKANLGLGIYFGYNLLGDNSYVSRLRSDEVTIPAKREVQVPIQEVIESTKKPHVDLAVNDPDEAGYVANRTHWKETVQMPLDFAWDGNTDGLHAVPFGDTVLYKISDILPTNEEISTCTVSFSDGDTITVAEIIDSGEFYDNEVGSSLVLGWGYVIIVRDPVDFRALDSNLNFETGIYFVMMENGAYITHLYSDSVILSVPVYHKIDEEYLPDHIAPDFEQNNPNEKDYIKNRTHWKEAPVTETILEETTIIPGGDTLGRLLNIQEGEIYTVVFDGIEYECVCKRAEYTVFSEADGQAVDLHGFYIGNESVFGAIIGCDFDDSGEPFFMIDCYIMKFFTESVQANEFQIIFPDEESHTVSITHTTHKVHKLDTDYINFAKEVDVPLCIEWDGEIGSRYNEPISVEGSRACLVKVYDRTLSDEELAKSMLTLLSVNAGEEESETESIDAGSLVKTDAFTASEGLYFLVNHKPYTTLQELGFNTVLKETGVYFLWAFNGDIGGWTAGLSSDTCTMKQLVYTTVPDECLSKRVFVNADFSVNDPNSPGFIKGLDREVIYGENVLPERHVTTGAANLTNMFTKPLEAGRVYIVYFNGIPYECTAKDYGILDSDSYRTCAYIGNAYFVGSIWGALGAINTGECFFAYTAEKNNGDIENLVVAATPDGDVIIDYYISVWEKDEYRTTIPMQYMPDGTPGKEIIDAPLNIQWDGEIGDYEHVSTSNLSYVKVSDDTFNAEDFVKCSYTIRNGAELSTSAINPDCVIESDGCVRVDDTAGLVIAGLTMIVSIHDVDAYNADNANGFPSNGLYLIKITGDDGDGYVSRLFSEEILAPTTVVRQIDQDCLPTPLQFPAVTAADAGKKLSFVVDDNGNWVQDLSKDEIPFFDLTEMGLPVLTDDDGKDGIVVTAGIDYAKALEIYEAVQRGAVRIRIELLSGIPVTSNVYASIAGTDDMQVISFNMHYNAVSADGVAITTHFTIMVNEDNSFISAVATSIDLASYE